MNEGVGNQNRASGQDSHGDGLSPPPKHDGTG
jgi:hypothetical protein